MNVSKQPIKYWHNNKNIVLINLVSDGSVRFQIYFEKYLNLIYFEYLILFNINCNIV